MDAERRRAKTRERVRAHRARETAAQAAERRRRDRERKRNRRAVVADPGPTVPEVPAVPIRQSETRSRIDIDPRTGMLRPPAFLGIDTHTLKPVFEDGDWRRRCGGCWG